MTTQSLKIGFIGLGIMGTPMAGHLIKGGHELYLYSLPAVPKELVAAGGKACANGKEVAKSADIIITMVPDTPDVGKALFGDNGVAAGLSKGKVVVDTNATCCSPMAFLADGCSCTRFHQAVIFGRPSVGSLLPNCGRKVVKKNIVGASAASASVKALPAAH